MTDRDELQRLARQVEQDRARLEEIQIQIDRVGAILTEHHDTQQVLDRLISDQTTGHVPVGAGILIPFTSKEKVLVDLGSDLYGERTPSQAKQIIEERQNDLTELMETLHLEGKNLRDRIERTAETFTEMAQTPEKSTAEEPTPEPTTQPQKKRRRPFGDELTLDD